MNTMDMDTRQSRPVPSLLIAEGTQFGRPQRRSRIKDPSARKRAVYVEKACLLCRKRKIRCDGTLPCQPCQKRSSLNCRYSKNPSDVDCDTSGRLGTSLGKPAPDISNTKGLAELTKVVSALQKKIDILEQRQQNVTREEPPEQSYGSSDRGSNMEEGRDDDVQSSTYTQATSPGFAGPTSANFGFGVASILLEQEGGSNTAPSKLTPDLGGSITSGLEEVRSTIPFEYCPSATRPASLHGLQTHDALRLVQVYHECVGILHPIVGVGLLERQATKLEFPHPDSYSTSGGAPASGPFAGEDFCAFKMVLAIGLLAEGGGSSSVAAEMHDSLQPVIMGQVLAGDFTLHGQILLLLTAFYHMFQDDCRLASRYVSIASRLMIEAGLHRNHIRLRRFPRRVEREKALLVLSTCIILDRQLNFNAGLPFTMKDSDIEIPEMETMPPYMKAMGSYIRMGPLAWAAMTDGRGRLKSHIKDEDFESIDLQVRRWQESLPAELRIERAEQDGRLEAGSATEMSFDRCRQFLRSILYLRANQFKIVIMRPLLFSPQTVNANMKQVRHVAQLANNTVDMITEMNEKHNLYEKQQPMLNLFLSSAMSILFLVYIHSLQDYSGELSEYQASARQGIKKGLGLIRDHSSSPSSQRLSKWFAGPQGLMCRLGLGFPQQGNNNHVAMAATPVTWMPSDVSSDLWARGYSQIDGHSGSFPPYSYVPSAVETNCGSFPFEFQGATGPLFPPSPPPFLGLNPLLFVPTGAEGFHHDALFTNIDEFPP